MPKAGGYLLAQKRKPSIKKVEKNNCLAIKKMIAPFKKLLKKIV